MSNNKVFKMSNEEARSAATTEYPAASMYDDEEEDDDDEADFDPGDDSHSDDDEDDGSDDDEEEEEEEGDCVILDGKLLLNEEGRLIYHGTWCAKSEFRAEAAVASGGGRGSAKFKLKSQEVFRSASASEKMKMTESSNAGENGAGSLSKKSPPLLFDFRRPTLSALDGDKNGSTPLPSRRTILFDGFFIEKSSPPASAMTATEGNGELKPSPQGKKMRERDVEIIFQLIDGNNNSNRHRQPCDDSVSMSYKVTGRGYNAFGPFVLDGAYATEPPGTNETGLVLRKMYGSGGNAKDTHVARGSKRRRKMESDDDDDDDDDEDWATEKADYSELIELTEDANLSVEELRRKYYGRGGANEEREGGDDGGGGKLPAKKAKWEESDDSECGF